MMKKNEFIAGLVNDWKVFDLNLSVGAFNVLMDHNLTTVGSIIALAPTEWLAIPIGCKRRREVSREINRVKRLAEGVWRGLRSPNRPATFGLIGKFEYGHVYPA